MMRALIFLLWFPTLALAVTPTLPQPAASGPGTRLERQIQQAMDQRLAFSKGWLKLGHYRLRGLGREFHGEADGPNFYLSPRGRTHPDEELIATLRAFAEPVTDESQHAQCKYLARRDYIAGLLKEHPIQPWLACEKQERWIDQLDADQLAVIFATSYMNNPASLFGHTFLKFHTRTNTSDKDLLNYGVNFAANTGRDGGTQFVWLGLTGGYPGTFSMLPYHQQLKEYTNLDGRDIWEYELTFTPAEVRFLVKHLLELERTSFDYFFIDENCSYFLLTALEAVRPTELTLTEDFGYFVIPSDTIRTLSRSPSLVKARHYRPSLASQFAFRTDLLNTHEQSWVQRLTSSRFTVREQIKTPEWMALPPERRALILDASLYYIGLREVREKRDWAERGYQAKVARASLGPQPETDSFQPRTQPPENGHDSFLLSASGGTFETHPFLEFQLRPATHNLLSNDEGYLPLSQLEILKTRVRLNTTDTRLRLQELTLLDLISASPITPFFSPFSWKVNGGLMRLMDRGEQSELDPYFDAGVGTTLALPGFARTWMISFAQLHTQYGEDVPAFTRVGASPQISLLHQHTSHWRSLASYEYRWYAFDQGQFPIWRMAQSFDTTKNWEWRWELNDVNHHFEIKGSWLWHVSL